MQPFAPPPTPSTPSTAAAPLFAPLLRHAPLVLALCLGITMLRSALVPADWLPNLWCSLAIGIPSWLVIDAGRLWLSRGQPYPWPAGWRGPALVMLGMAVGLLVGDITTRLVLGHPLLQGDMLVSTLVTTAVANGIASLLFYLGGKAHALENQVTAVQRDAAEARLKLLESQLEPHMLFNTLANLRVLIAADPARAQTMLDQLIAYLRATLGAARQPWHTLEAEFARLNDYLALMAVRMGPRLHYQLQLPPALAGIPVAPLLLQPLVENAIRHGLEPQPGPGQITVQALQLGQGAAARLQLQVTDNGAGLPPDSLPAAADAPTLPDRHFGLQQVRDRLAGLYGSAATLELRTVPTGGTSATIVFPLPGTAPSP